MNVTAIRPPDNEASPLPNGFDAFWLLYPRHVCKKDARRAWDRIDPALYVEIITATAAWRQVWINRGELQFVPHPSTWLNGERWEDELPREAKSGHQSHQRFEPSKPGARSEIPEDVLAMMHKIMGRK